MLATKKHEAEAIPQPFLRAVQLWFFTQVVSCVINVGLLPWHLNPRVLIFAILALASVSAVQIIMTAALLWRIRTRRQVIYILSGILLGFVMPIGLYLLIASLAQFLGIKPAVGWLAVVGWAMIGCWVPLLGGGLIGGAWVGHARWKSALA